MLLHAFLNFSHTFCQCMKHIDDECLLTSVNSEPWPCTCISTVDALRQSPRRLKSQPAGCMSTGRQQAPCNSAGRYTTHSLKVPWKGVTVLSDTCQSSSTVL